MGLRPKAKGSNVPLWNKTTAMRLGTRVSIDLVDSDVILHAKGKRAAFSGEILDLLAFYQKPHTLEEGVHLLCRSAKSAQGVADAFGRLIRLCEQGVLVPEAGADSPFLSQPYNQTYGPAVQIVMLEDRARTSGFVDAIRSTVRAGDIVVDLGSGSGVLAVAAAQAGARRVYAIEVRPIAVTAARFFEASGYGDRITLIRGLSMEITLPERADVLISEMIGNEPLGEQILETARDAVARMLKPGARLIPSSLQILVTPVVVPEKFRRKSFFTPELLDRWQSWYGLPFRGLLDPPASQASLVRTFIDPWSARRWPTLGPPALLQAFDLSLQSDPPFESETTLYLQREGHLGGFLIHFEATLAKGISITTEPKCVDRSNHWRSPLWLLPSVLKVKPGKKLLARSGWGRTPAFEIVNEP